jgi:N-acyl-D-aspartate/D-glutamate deacylase
MLSMERNEAISFSAMKAGMPWDWTTYPEFLESIERTPKGVNVLSYVGLSPLMVYVMGLENAKSRGATKEEMDEMCRLLREAMEHGACGFSVQLAGEESAQRDYDGTPMVTDLMSIKDLKRFARELGQVGRGFIQCTGPTPGLTEKLAAESGRPVIWNLVCAGVDQHGTPVAGHEQILDWLSRANREKGLRIIGQALTIDAEFRLTFEHWNLFDSSPVWRVVTQGTPAERAQKMRDPEWRRKLVEEYDSGKGPTLGGGTEEEVTAGAGDGITTMIIEEAYAEHLRKFEGMNMGEVAKARGQHVVECLLDVALEDNLKTQFKSKPKPTPLQSLKDIASSPFTIPGLSDGGAHAKFNPGNFYTTSFLTQVCREHKMMDLEEAHWKLSKYPAQAAGLLDRGHIAEGMPADIIIYDYEALKVEPGHVAYDLPGDDWRRICRAEGYHYTIVNGQVTFEGNDCTGATPGKLLRHGAARGNPLASAVQSKL